VLPLPGGDQLVLALLAGDPAEHQDQLVGVDAETCPGCPPLRLGHRVEPVEVDGDTELPEGQPDTESPAGLHLVVAVGDEEAGVRRSSLLRSAHGAREHRSGQQLGGPRVRLIHHRHVPSRRTELGQAAQEAGDERVQVDHVRAHLRHRVPELVHGSQHRLRVRPVDRPAVALDARPASHGLGSQQVHVVAGPELLGQEVVQQADHTTPVHLADVQDAQLVRP
jgi:hypothetical protein